MLSQKTFIACALASLLSGAVFADGGVLSTPKSVVGLDNDQIKIEIDFKTPTSGDLYLFTEADGQRIYLLADGQLSAEPIPHTANSTFSGHFEVYSLTTFPELSPRSYPVYSIVTVPGGDPTNIKDWVNGVTTMNKVGIQLGLPPEISGDFDGDGFADGDRNHDGFFDDDRNQDGYHDNDLDKDGFRETDADHDGFDDEDRDHDGFRDDDSNRDGFADQDKDFDGFRDDLPIPSHDNSNASGDNAGGDGNKPDHGPGAGETQSPVDGEPLGEFGDLSSGQTPGNGQDQGGEIPDADQGGNEDQSGGGESGNTFGNPGDSSPGAASGNGGFGGFGG